jgi:two-component system chemotaxis response regulator CheB
LWEIRDDELLRYRCHVGHAYSAEALNQGQSAMLEEALWSAVRALEEQMVLARRIVERARKGNQSHAATAFERRARQAEEHSSLIRQLLLQAEKGDIGEPILSGDD